MDPAHFEGCTSATFSTQVCSAALRADLDIEFTHTVTKHTKWLAAILYARKNSVIATEPNSTKVTHSGQLFV
jgi:hypothetical protein